MKPTLARLFAPFEGTRGRLPLQVFRVAFFGAVALHFFPSLIWLDHNYSRGSIRTDEWNHWLYTHFWRIPHAGLRAWAVITMVACLLALVGLWPRITAGVAAVGLYAFASFNGLHLQTLALEETWAILILWVVCDGRSDSRLLSSLILFQILLAVFFSGLEKLFAGWAGRNEMRIVLAYPRGFMVRDWVASQAWLHGAAASWTFTWFTLVVEIGAPIALLFRRTRLPALIVYQAFFLGIIAMLEVPPLFYFTFAAGALLALSDDEVARLTRRRAPSGSPAPSGRSSA